MENRKMKNEKLIKALNEVLGTIDEGKGDYPGKDESGRDVTFVHSSPIDHYEVVIGSVETNYGGGNKGRSKEDYTFKTEKEAYEFYKDFLNNPPEDIVAGDSINVFSIRKSGFSKWCEGNTIIKSNESGNLKYRFEVKDFTQADYK